MAGDRAEQAISAKNSCATVIRSTRCIGPWQCGHFHSEGFAGEGDFGGRNLAKQSAAEWQHAGSCAVGEEAEVADAGKASRQDVLYESAQELF